MESRDQNIANQITGLSDSNDTETKTLLVSMSVILKAEYSTMITVPADASDDRIKEICDQICNQNDISDFVLDNEYWKRGSTSWSEQDE